MAQHRTAIISDIHGNFDGLMAVWRDIEANACNDVICLGDLIDGGPGNDAVARFLMSSGVPCVRGNHDETSIDGLSTEAAAFIESLPETLTRDDILYTHISPRPCLRKIVDEYEAWNVFDETAYPLIFVGHAHIPLIFGRRSPHFATAAYYPVRHNEPFAFDTSDRYIVCVGAVGYPRDGVRYPRYAIVDHDRMTVEMRLVDGPVLPFG